MNLIQALFLGLVQGLTEWFPVSSSGHLALFQNLFSLDVPVLFDILLHVGTLIVVLLVFYKDIFKIIKSIFTWNTKSEYFKLAIFIIIGSVGTAIIGYFFRDLFVGFFNNLLAVGIAFLFTGVLLFFSDKKGNKKLNYKNSFLIGLMQGVALIPGISRSGSTISTGMLLGIERKKVARFSFLLMIPAVIGGLIFESGSIADINLVNAFFGVLVSVIVGYVSLRYLLRLIEKGKFKNFSWYCFLIGLITIIISFF